MCVCVCVRKCMFYNMLNNKKLINIPICHSPPLSLTLTVWLLEDHIDKPHLRSSLEGYDHRDSPNNAEWHSFLQREVVQFRKS